MCGIAGIFNLNRETVVQKELHQMDYALRHRGPDGHGEMIDHFIGLANRRLAIIDPTSAGNQPLASSDKNYWITFNGEIFNFREIRKKLIKEGFKFRTGTDTEVVLNAYIFYGERCASKFIGQFAFAIWDKKKEQLYLCRDHLGVNPLFYAKSGKTFLFASEVKAIMASGKISKELNRESIYHYLSVFSIPQPQTVFAAVKSIMPGTFMTVNRQGSKTKTYYRLPDVVSNNTVSFEDACSRLEQLLNSSVKSAMVADVSVGAFLSGGIDSSSVVALMSRNTKKRIKTYSLWAEGFGEAFDERNYAKIVSDKYNTSHTEYTLTENSLIREFPEYISYLDQPNGESLESYFLSKVIGSDVKVALSGIGGDELFAGYHGIIYQTKLISNIYQSLPSAFKNIFLSLVKKSRFPENVKKTVSVSAKFLDIRDPVQKRLFLYFVYNDAEKSQLLSRDFITNNNWNTSALFMDILRKARNLPSIIDKLSYLDLSSYTRDNLLLNTNISGMAHSLEIRVPLLDRRLVDFSFSIPPEYKLKNGVSKYILRKVMKELLPPEILSHKKQGFGLPRIKYMRNKLKPLILESLSPESVKKRGIFNPLEVKSHVTNFYRADNNKMLWTEHLRVWTLFIFEMWARRFLD